MRKTVIAESGGADGIGKHDDVDDSSFNADQFAKGIEIEREHSDDLEVIESLVRDHLSEDPNYYTKLIKMEKESEMSGVTENDVLNPLYNKHQSIVKAEAQVAPMKETSAFSNSVEGMCPKCNIPMGEANLGLAMGHVKVHYCETCRVAEPCVNPGN